MTTKTNKELLLDSIYNNRFKADLLSHLLGILHSIIEDRAYTLEDAGNEIMELILDFEESFDYSNYHTALTMLTTEEDAND